MDGNMKKAYIVIDKSGSIYSYFAYYQSKHYSFAPTKVDAAFGIKIECKPGFTINDLKLKFA
jgi:hypothetical protein